MGDVNFTSHLILLTNFLFKINLNKIRYLGMWATYKCKDLYSANVHHFSFI